MLYRRIPVRQLFRLYLFCYDLLEPSYIRSLIWIFILKNSPCNTNNIYIITLRLRVRYVNNILVVVVHCSNFTLNYWNESNGLYFWSKMTYFKYWKDFVYKFIAYILFLNIHMQLISGTILTLPSALVVRGNIMPHFMWTGRTICHCHGHVIKCTLYFFPTKNRDFNIGCLSFIIIIIQNSQNQNAGVTVDQHALKC